MTESVEDHGPSAEGADTHRGADGAVVAELLAALKAMRRAFGDPMTRRALGGHNECQQEAILTASALIRKAEENAK